MLKKMMMCNVDHLFLMCKYWVLKGKVGIIIEAWTQVLWAFLLGCETSCRC